MDLELENGDKREVSTTHCDLLQAQGLKSNDSSLINLKGAIIMHYFIKQWVRGIIQFPLIIIQRNHSFELDCYAFIG